MIKIYEFKEYIVFMFVSNLIILYLFLYTEDSGLEFLIYVLGK